LTAQVDSWVIQPPKKNKRGGFSSFVNRSAGDVSRIRIQATSLEGDALCTLPFGVSSKYDKAQSEDGKRNLELGVNSLRLEAFLHAFDEKIVKEATANMADWYQAFNTKKDLSKLTEQDVREYYRPALTPADSEKGFGPKCRTKVNVLQLNDRQELVKVYVPVADDKSSATGSFQLRRGTLDDITKFCKAVPIFEVIGLWFMNKSFGISLITTDIIVFPNGGHDECDFNINGKKPMLRTDIPVDMDIDIDPAREARDREIMPPPPVPAPMAPHASSAPPRPSAPPASSLSSSKHLPPVPMSMRELPGPAAPKEIDLDDTQPVTD